MQQFDLVLEIFDKYEDCLHVRANGLRGIAKTRGQYDLGISVLTSGSLGLTDRWCLMTADDSSGAGDLGRTVNGAKGRREFLLHCHQLVLQFKYSGLHCDAICICFITPDLKGLIRLF